MKIFATVADGSLVIFKQNQGKNTKYKAPELILPACLLKFASLGMKLWFRK